MARILEPQIHADPGESAEDAIRREITEELGVEVVEIILVTPESVYHLDFAFDSIKKAVISNFENKHIL